MLDSLADRVPKFYGSVTVGERGQIAIPAEARRDQEITPTTKLLAFGGQDSKGLIFVKAEFVTEFITSISAALSEFEQTLRAMPMADTGENESQ
jgi:bifunctional DNA-binding transcriptional regulator/antitoxin component of YhaV-PrlF toxin-antitoxin module